jgi:hypothetical protein
LKENEAECGLATAIDSDSVIDAHAQFWEAGARMYFGLATIALPFPPGAPYTVIVTKLEGII